MTVSKLGAFGYSTANASEAVRAHPEVACARGADWRARCEPLRNCVRTRSLFHVAGPLQVV